MIPACTCKHSSSLDGSGWGLAGSTFQKHARLVFPYGNSPSLSTWPWLFAHTHTHTRAQFHAVRICQLCDRVYVHLWVLRKSRVSAPKVCTTCCSEMFTIYTWPHCWVGSQFTPTVFWLMCVNLALFCSSQLWARSSASLFWSSWYIPHLGHSPPPMTLDKHCFHAL